MSAGVEVNSLHVLSPPIATIIIATIATIIIIVIIATMASRSTHYAIFITGF